MKRILLMTCIMAAVFSLSCGGGSDSDSFQNVRVLLTDAPAENLKSVFVTISNVRVHGSAIADEGEAGWKDITVTAEMPVDLLTLEGGVVKTLGGENLDPGHYQQIRLILEENTDGEDYNSFVVLNNGEMRPLEISSGDTGLKINRSFVVTLDTRTVILLDFDAKKSVNVTGNETYSLKPVISATISTEPLTAYVTH